MFVKIAQAAVRQAKLATFLVETLTQALLELFVYMTWLGSAYSTYGPRGGASVYRSIGRRGASVVSCYLSRSYLMTFLWLSQETKWINTE